MQDEVVISIVMPAYNAEKYIQESIDSVINQSYSHWELIIVNDESIDNTVLIVERNQKLDNRIKLIHQKNKKQGAARNTGIKEAKGKWIAFIDSDDLWEQNKLEVQLLNCQDYDVVFSRGLILLENTKVFKEYPNTANNWTGEQMYEILCNSNPIPNLSVMMKREWIKKAGYQDESKEIVGCEDWEYWLRLAKNGATFCCLDQKLFIYRVHDQGISRNTTQMRLAETYALYRNIDLNRNNKSIVIKRLTNLADPLILNFVKENRIEEALSLIKLLLKINPILLNQYKYFILQYIMKYTGRRISRALLVLGNKSLKVVN